MIPIYINTVSGIVNKYKIRYKMQILLVAAPAGGNN